VLAFYLGDGPGYPSMSGLRADDESSTYKDERCYFDKFMPG
jgi:hypothetical protein